MLCFAHIYLSNVQPSSTEPLNGIVSAPENEDNPSSDYASTPVNGRSVSSTLHDRKVSRASAPASSSATPPLRHALPPMHIDTITTLNSTALTGGAHPPSVPAQVACTRSLRRTRSSTTSSDSRKMVLLRVVDHRCKWHRVHRWRAPHPQRAYPCQRHQALCRLAVIRSRAPPRR